MDPSIDPLLAKPIDIELSLDKRLSDDSRKALSEMRRRVELLAKKRSKLLPGYDEREFDSIIKEYGLKFEFIPRVYAKR